MVGILSFLSQAVLLRKEFMFGVLDMLACNRSIMSVTSFVEIVKIVCGITENRVYNPFSIITDSVESSHFFKEAF